MTVLELIEKLRDMPQNAIAVVRGYEGGYDDIQDVKHIKVELNPNACVGNSPYLTNTDNEYLWFYGVFETALDSEGAIYDAVFIEQYDGDDKHSKKRKHVL